MCMCVCVCAPATTVLMTDESVVLELMGAVCVCVCWGGHRDRVMRSLIYPAVLI